MSSNVTQHELARKAGVSQRTVSYVFTQPDRVAEGTRQRVLDVARDMGFRLNASASAVRSGRFNAIALLLSTERHRSRLFMDTLDGIDDALVDRNYHLTLSRLPDEKLTSSGFMPKALRELMADGLLINYSTAPPIAMARMIEEHQLPSVYLNHIRKHDCVYPDDEAAGREITQRLIGLGHRKIGFINFTAEVHYSTIDRRRGYEQAMQEAGYTPMLHVQSLSINDQESVLHQWLKQADRPTAVVCYGDALAMRLIHAAARQGLRVPEDISVASFHGVVSEMAGMNITTMKRPDYDIGHRGALQLLSKIDQPDHDHPPLVLPFTYDHGQTVAPL